MDVTGSMGLFNGVYAAVTGSTWLLRDLYASIAWL